MGIFSYAKGMLITFIFMIVFGSLGGYFQHRTQLQGYLVGAQGLLTFILGVFLFNKFKKISALSKLSKNTLPLIFIFSGVADFLWSMIYYKNHLSSTTRFLMFLTEMLYVTGYLMGSIGIIFSIKDNPRNFFLKKIIIFPIVFTFPIAGLLLIHPLVNIDNNLFYGILYFSEILAILSSFILINLAFMIIVSTRGMPWSVFSSGIICFIFSEWSIRFNKLIGIPTHFGYESFFLTFGLYTAMIPFFIEKKLKRIESFEITSISSGQNLGNLIMLFIFSSIIFFLQDQQITTLKHICICVGFGSAMIVYVNYFFTWKIQELTESISLLISDSKRNEDKKLAYEFKKSYEIVLLKTIKDNEENEKRKSITKIAQMAHQVSHDIRSPLAVLNMIFSSKLNGINEEDRIIIRGQINRIQDIANNLIMKNKNSDIAITKECKSLPLNSECHRELLSSAIENIITEKRLYFRSKLGVTIEGDIYGGGSYGIFSKINLVEFKRILSNLMNNAVEAFDKQMGTVTIRLQAADDKVQVIIEDNGRGIPSHIIKKLGQKGVSFGKEDSIEAGSGLGLYHAKTTVEEWGGRLDIQSEEEKGTTIIITLPRFEAPSWFVPKILLHSEQAVVVLDDDQGIHFTWNNRFKELLLIDGKFDIIHLSTPNDFELWVESKMSSYKDALFLSDYELIGFEKTGLDLLEKYRPPNAILVTSHYENQSIRERCSRLGVRLIPKMLAGFVPIEVIKITKVNQDCPFFDSVYIDDDAFLRDLWKRHATKENVHLLTLSSTREFDEYKKRISKEATNIYLDSDLGEGEVPGEVFAKMLYEEGYQKIFMANGHGPSCSSHLPWINLVSKDYPLSIDENF